MSELPPPQPPPLPDGSEPPARHVRYNVRSLLVVMTLLAAFFALEDLIPGAPSRILVGAIWVVATSLLLVGVLFAKQEQRVFCLGALVVVSSMWSGLGGMFMGGIHQILGQGTIWSQWADLVVISIAAAGNGWVCVQAWRFFVRIDPN